MAGAQMNSSGIKWITDLSWQQVKQKAKQENKHIFLDVFATWCGPCKEMDKRVYVNDTVGDFFNSRFISVKVQTDQTQNDGEQVKKWYEDAQVISKQYRVLSLPTFIFLSSNGSIVHKALGFHNVEKFISEATIALQPGQAYIDPYCEFDQLEADYNEGKKDYGRMLYMIKAARELGKTAFEKLLIQDFCTYLETTSDRYLYAKENMEFLNEIEVKSNSRLFAIFYPDGKKADKAMGQKGFSQRMVNRSISREIVQPFLQLKSGVMPFRTDGKAFMPQDSSEANWNLLYKRIRASYPKEYAQKGVLNGKIAWYEQRQNYPAYYSAYLEKLDRYGFDSLSKTSNINYPSVNANCWFLFLRIEDKKTLMRAAKWMHKLIKKIPQDPAFMDTYANLLY
ncbi:MAG: thioredoxin family protein, partial [Chitinophagaceae bacterium]|nr:thioredoxin family protein [Chitinophagaceae bacterium]